LKGKSIPSIKADSKQKKDVKIINEMQNMSEVKSNLEAKLKKKEVKVKDEDEVTELAHNDLKKNINHKVEVKKLHRDKKVKADVRKPNEDKDLLNKGKPKTENKPKIEFLFPRK